MATTDSVNPYRADADSRRMRRRSLLVALTLLVVACGDPGTESVGAPIGDPTPPPTTATTTTTTSTEAPTTTTTAAPITDPENYREEWVIETARGLITTIEEHTAAADRILEIFGSTDPAEYFREVIVSGDQAWNRYFGHDWEIIEPSALGDLLNQHPFTSQEVVTDFAAVGPNSHEGRDTTTFSASGPVVADYSGIDPSTVVTATAEVSLYANDTFATYELYFERDDGEFARLTYRTYDYGAPIVIELPVVVAAGPSCRDRGKQLIDEVGAYRSRYQLHHNALVESIDELRTEDPWAWQRTVYIRDQDLAHIDTLWVDGGYEYWRPPGEDWQPDIEFRGRSWNHRDFVDDLWVPDVVEQFEPIEQAEVAERQVDVYSLDLEDMRQLNDALVPNTASLEATLWIEPCSLPELVKLELIATGSGYADGEFHVTYELYDIGTTDTIDIPPDALEG